MLRSSQAPSVACCTDVHSSTRPSCQVCGMCAARHVSAHLHDGGPLRHDLGQVGQVQLVRAHAVLALLSAHVQLGQDLEPVGLVSGLHSAGHRASSVSGCSSYSCEQCSSTSTSAIASIRQLIAGAEAPQ